MSTPVDQFTWEWMTAKIKRLDESYAKLHSMAWDTKQKLIRIKDELNRHLGVGDDDDEDEIELSDLV